MLRLMAHLLARLLPRDLRDAHAEEIARDIDARFRHGQRVSTVTDLAVAIVRERRDDRHRLPFPRVRTYPMTNLLQDFRFALRMIQRRPGLSAAIILILGIGIGSATAIVSLASATLLRPITARDPERLVEIRSAMSYTDFRALQRGSDIAESVFAYGSQSGVSLKRGGVTRRVPATLVSGNYFEGLGVRPAAGRLLTPADDVPGGIPAVVLSHRLWSSAFGRSQDVIGETVYVNSRPVVVVGVAPPGFKGLSLANVGDVWMPAAFTPDLATGFIGRPAALTGEMLWLRVVVRLKPGVTMEQASAGLTALKASMHPPAAGAAPQVMPVDPVVAAVVTSGSRADLRTFMLLLVAVAATLLLLGSSNVANLLLARVASRRHELSVRAALGAGRGRLMMQLLVESLVLAVAGGAAGVLVAAAALRAVGRYRLPGDIAIEDLGLAIDGMTMITTVALSIAAVLVFGPLPAWLGSRRDLRPALSESGRGSTRLPLGRMLLAMQVALCVMLVGGGLLFARGLQRALSLDLGYDPRHVAMTTADPALERLTPAATDQYISEVLSRLRADRSITAAGVSVIRPMRGGISTSIVIEGRTAADDPHIAANLVSEGWMEAMALRLLKGRTLNESDRRASQRVGVISESAARAFWPGRDPIGARFKFDDDAEAPFYEVVGVVADARYGKVDAEVQPFVYLSIFDHGMSAFRAQLHFFARTRGEPRAAIGHIQDAAKAAAPHVPLFGGMTLEDHVASVLMPQRLGLVLLLVFAATGLVLAAGGVYAIAAHTVSMRIREIGIRMALGARRGRVVMDLLRDGAFPLGAGIIAGMILQLWSSQFAESFVFGLDVRGPAQILGAGAIVCVAAFTGLLLPARRAAGVDPSIALREP